MITLIHPLSCKKKKRKKSEICLIPHSGAASEGVQGRLASSTGLKKGTEHTEPGGALAPAHGEGGQLAGEQEVLGLIRQRETPLGQRSQRPVGTWLARRARSGGVGGVDLSLGVEVTTRSGSASNQSSADSGLVFAALPAGDPQQGGSSGYAQSIMGIRAMSGIHRKNKRSGCQGRLSSNILISVMIFTFG